MRPTTASLSPFQLLLVNMAYVNYGLVCRGGAILAGKNRCEETWLRVMGWRMRGGN